MRGLFTLLPFPNTLAWRLFLLSSLAALVGIAIVAFFISSNYRNGAEARLQDVLTANVFNLMGNVQIDDDNKLMGFPNLGDSRYSLFDSGWYWSVQQVGEVENRLASPSLSGRIIEVPAAVEFDETFQRSFVVTDNDGATLSGLEAQVFLGEGNDLFSFKITANKSVLEEDISDFRRTLFVTLSIFAFTIILAMSQLVRFGLRPISRATRSLANIRRGEAKRIDGTYPDEIQPLIDETNALIESNNTIVERARTQVGNLAHSLKTPLAVMQNEISSIPAKKRSILNEQTSLMRQQVQVYLDRARISARSSTAIARTPLREELDKLASVIAKLNRGKIINTDLANVEGVDFEGEVHDLQEIFGNLIENASKYAKSQVSVSASFEDDIITIQVEDDGPGMTSDEIDKAMRRGGRIDEGKTGWGLGLSIVTDIVDEYNGSFNLDKSKLGGLRTTIGLPGRK